MKNLYRIKLTRFISDCERTYNKDLSDIEFINDDYYVLAERIDQVPRILESELNSRYGEDVIDNIYSIDLVDNFIDSEFEMEELEETAPEVRVQEQSQNKMLDSIIENQVKTLQSVQEQCVAQGSFETVVLIAKTLIDIGTIHQQYQD